MMEQRSLVGVTYVVELIPYHRRQRSLETVGTCERRDEFSNHQLSRLRCPWLEIFEETYAVICVVTYVVICAICAVTYVAISLETGFGMHGDSTLRGQGTQE